jgi:YD repeat-containing protein
MRRYTFRFLNAGLGYDLTARTTTVTGALGHATVHHWNNHLKTVKVVSPLGSKTLTKYDRYGRVTGTTDALGHVTQFGHDEYGNVLRADGTAIATEYDKSRNRSTSPIPTVPAGHIRTTKRVC